jgi:REP element-mobilizing transposase RayT
MRQVCAIFCIQRMARKPLIRSTELPYHVTLRCNNREWFKLPLERVWKLITDELYRISILGDAKVHAFVLMGNHLHLLISTPGWSLDKVMAEFGSAVTRTFNLLSGRSGHLFGGRYHWSIIQSPLYYACVFKYIYRNPVRAGMVEKVEDHVFSSLHGIFGKSYLPLPIHYCEIERQTVSYIPDDLDEMLSWLNQPFKKEIHEAIGKGLRKKVFKLSNDRSARTPIELSI